MRRGLNLISGSGAAAKRNWTPAKLLIGGTGFWGGGFAPASGRLWQDNGGTTLAASPGQTIGRVASAAGTSAAQQSSAAARPTLAVWPKGGRRNLGLHTDDVRLWTPSSISTPNETDIIEAPALSEHRADQRNIPFVSGKAYTVALDAKAIGSRVLRISFSSNAFPATGRTAVFDLVNGTVLTKDTPVTASISAASDGYWRCRVTANCNATALGHVFSCICTWNGTVETLSYTGDGVSGLKLRRFQLEDAASTSAYQQVGTAFDISESGVAPVWHLFDDGNDALPLILPAGSYATYSVSHLGAIASTVLTSNGTTPLDVLLHERQADMLLRAGTLSAMEISKLTAYWQGLYLG